MIRPVIFTEEMRRLCGILNNMMAEVRPGLVWKSSYQVLWHVVYDHNYAKHKILQLQENVAKKDISMLYLSCVFFSPPFPLYF